MVQTHSKTFLSRLGSGGKAVRAAFVAGSAEIGPLAEEPLTDGFQLWSDGVQTLLAHRCLIGVGVNSPAFRRQGTRKRGKALRLVARVTRVRVDRCQYQHRDCHDCQLRHLFSAPLRLWPIPASCTAASWCAAAMRR